MISWQHKGVLEGFLGSRSVTWQLLYKATRDGFRARDFHRLCDSKGPTLTIIKSTNGYLFGGYTRQSWISRYSYVRDTHAFLFTLTNPYSIRPTKYSIINGRQNTAFYGGSNYGPTFGGGHDIYVPDNSKYNNGYTNFGHTYRDTTGRRKNTFTGSYKFKTSEIEVYRIYM